MDNSKMPFLHLSVFLEIIKAGFISVLARLAKTPKIQLCELHQIEIFYITFALLLSIRKPLNFSDQSDLS